MILGTLKISILIKLSLQELWDSQNRKEAAQYLKKLYFWVTHSRLTPITEAANTVKKHWDGTLNYFDSKITNGLLRTETKGIPRKGAGKKFKSACDE